MSENSKIEWTDHTFNPWRQDKFRKWTPEGWGAGKPRKRTSIANWREPVRWNAVEEAWLASKSGIAWSRPRPRVFCASLADWLDDEVPIEWLADLLQLIHQTPHLDWLLLTKRPENWFPRIEAVFTLLNVDRAAYEQRPGAAELVDRWFGEPPYRQAPANVWIGTTVEDQVRADERIPELLKIPAKVRFLSCEPLLGAVDLSLAAGVNRHIEMQHSGPWLHWVICGGESGSGARPMHPEWARDLCDQCMSAGVPFFFKQWGEWAPCFASADIKVNEVLTVAKGDFTAHWKAGKLKAGRLLDGREHNAFPG